MKTPALLLLLAIALITLAGCNVPTLKSPVFSKQADTVFARYEEIYQPDAINLQWSMTSDSIASLEVKIRNSRKFTFDQKAELEKLGRQFSNELVAVIDNAEEFSSLTVTHEWKNALISKNLSIEYNITPGTTATVSSQPSLFAPETTDNTAMTNGTATRQQ